MKYLIVVIVVAIVVWMLAARNRQAPPAKPRRTARSAPAPQDMVECSHCGVHLPRAEALSADLGNYCSEAHRLAGPRRR